VRFTNKKDKDAHDDYKPRSKLLIRWVNTWVGAVGDESLSITDKTPKEIQQNLPTFAPYLPYKYPLLTSLNQSLHKA
jgi:hypothetical protein